MKILFSISKGGVVWVTSASDAVLSREIRIKILNKK
jgi:hypothetical protein